MAVKSIMIVGVGGQGTLLASRLLGSALLSKGYDVKVSEVHGMSQRGGSVVTYVKYGDQVCSPTVEKGEADYILAFEQLEGGPLAALSQTGWQVDRQYSADRSDAGCDRCGGISARRIGCAQSERSEHHSARCALNGNGCRLLQGGECGAHGRVGAAYGSQPGRVGPSTGRNRPPKFLEMNKLAFSLGYDYCA